MPATLPALLTRLRDMKPELRQRFGVSGVSVFGSFARGEAHANSDLDLLIDFDPQARPTHFLLARLEATLTDALGVRVETVPRDALNPRLAPFIQAELVNV